MAHAQNIEFPNYPFAPPHPFPFPPYVPPPSHPVAPPFAHPPPFPAPIPPKPSNPPPSPMIPKPPPHSFSPPTPAPIPHPHLPPPPPHIVPTPPLPPPPTPGHHSTIIIAVFVSLGGLFFLAFLSAALFCFMKKRKRRTIKEFEDYEFDDRMKVEEEVVRGPHGEQAVLVTFEEDIHAHETRIKDGTVSEASHGGLIHHPQSLDVASSSTANTGNRHVENTSSGTT